MEIHFRNNSLVMVLSDIIIIVNGQKKLNFSQMRLIYCIFYKNMENLINFFDFDISHSVPWFLKIGTFNNRSKR